MAIIGNGTNLRFSSGKRWIYFESSNLHVEYLIEDKKYVIWRMDDKPFDGTEEIDALFFGNMKKPVTLDEIIEYEINLLAGAQIEPEVSMFTEFDWGFNKDKTKIYVLPVFLDKGTNIIIAAPEPFESNVECSFGTVKRIRNGNIDLDGCKHLSLKKEN